MYAGDEIFGDDITSGPIDDGVESGRPFRVINADTDESHGEYETLAEARGAVRYDRLEAYEIWNDETGVRVEACEPYRGDDARARQGLGQ